MVIPEKKIEEFDNTYSSEEEQRIIANAIDCDVKVPKRVVEDMKDEGLLEE